jgi:hypothetical protein
MLDGNFRNGVQEFWIEGQQYLKVARQAWPNKPIFTPEIVYQLCAMAIEKLCMAWMTQEKQLPENHTLRDLVRNGDKIDPWPIGLKVRLMRMDRFMALCPLDPTPMPKPEATDVAEFLELAAEVEAIIEAKLSRKVLV